MIEEGGLTYNHSLMSLKCSPTDSVCCLFSVRSRVLMSIKDEGEETAEYAPHLPFTYKDLFIRWFSSEATASAMMPHSSDGVTVHFDAPMTPNVEVTDKDLIQDQPVRLSLQPDMAADVLTQVVSANVNATS